MMRTFFIFMLVVSGNISLVYAGWEDQLAKYKNVISNDKYSLILKQYNAFKDGKLPKIADPVIKQIDIEESGEKLINIRDQKNSRIKMLPNPKTPFASPDNNSGFEEASKIRFGLYKKLELLVKALDKLAPNFGYEPAQISIYVFEGLRNIKTQEQIFINKLKEIQQENPTLTYEQAEIETSKWVSPVKNNIPVHSTGAAVDIRLFDLKNNEFVDMGKFGVIWGANPAALTFFNDISEEQIKNRIFLLLSAASVDLINYPYEFWHLSTGDRYAAYWLGSKLQKANYGSVN